MHPAVSGADTVQSIQPRSGKVPVCSSALTMHWARGVAQQRMARQLEPHHEASCLPPAQPQVHLPQR